MCLTKTRLLADFHCPCDHLYKLFKMKYSQERNPFVLTKDGDFYLFGGGIQLPWEHAQNADQQLSFSAVKILLISTQLSEQRPLLDDSKTAF